MRKNWLRQPPLFSKYQPTNHAAERVITHRAMLREVENEREYLPPWEQLLMAA